MSQLFEDQLGPASSAMPAAGKVLVANRDRDVLLAVERILGAEGYDVVTARSGEEAIRKAQEHLPSLLILDVRLPLLSGYEVCRRLRSDWRFAARGIIMLTSEAVASQRAIGLASGVDDFVLMPVDPLELAARVRLTLRRTQEMRSSSPLTGLPGNLHIQHELQRRVGAGRDVALLYVDIDHFKAYNDHYGFLRGDEAIRTLADVLRKAVEGRPDAFLGHIGGDDFVVLARPTEAAGIAEDVVSSFQEKAVGLYESEDAARGWIEINDRQGRKHRYGILTLSIGVATNAGDALDDHRRLVDVATEMKQYAKSRSGSTVAVDKRGGKNVDAMMRPSPARPGEGRGQTPKAVGAIQFASALPRRSSLLRLARGGGAGGRARTGRRPGMARRLSKYAAVALLALAVAAGPATMVLAENALPGQLLYRVKRAVEFARLGLERSPEKDVALHLEFATRRVGELRYLVEEASDPPLVAMVSDNLTEHTDAAVRTISGFAEELPDAAIVHAHVRLVVGQNIAVLQELVAVACGGGSDRRGPPFAACHGLQRALERSSGAMAIVRQLPPPGRDRAEGMPEDAPAKGAGKDRESGDRGEKQDEPPRPGNGRQGEPAGGQKPSPQEQEPSPQDREPQGQQKEPPAKGKGGGGPAVGTQGEGASTSNKGQEHEAPPAKGKGDGAKADGQTTAAEKLPPPEKPGEKVSGGGPPPSPGKPG